VAAVLIDTVRANRPLKSSSFPCSERSNMTQHDPAVADRAPSADKLTPYDNDHLKIYVRLLDAEAAGADWKEVARIVLGMDPERARGAWESHPARGKWMTEKQGYLDGSTYVLSGGRWYLIDQNLAKEVQDFFDKAPKIELPKAEVDETEETYNERVAGLGRGHDLPRPTAHKAYRSSHGN
jgi:uncharacterized protein DUF6119/type VI secretion system activator RovC-like protein